MQCPARSDRKSTRLNSSHDQISYAVFCLKKKNVDRHLCPFGPIRVEMGPHFAASPEYGRGVAVVTLLLTFWPLDRCHPYSLVYLPGLNVSSADGSDRTNIRTQG